MLISFFFCRLISNFTINTIFNDYILDVAAFMDSFFDYNSSRGIFTKLLKANYNIFVTLCLKNIRFLRQKIAF